MSRQICFCVLWMVIQLMYDRVSCQSARHLSCMDNFPTTVCAAFRLQNNCPKVASACQRSCGYCTDPTPAPPAAFLPPAIIANCRDASVQCRSLALAGFCQTNANVRAACLPSCNMCIRVLDVPKRGTWGKWGPYGRCSVTCGVGTRKRYRKCVGKGCDGPSTDTERCQPKLCPKEGPVCSDAYSYCKVNILGNPQACFTPAFNLYCKKSCGRCPDNDPPPRPPVKPGKPGKCKPWSAYGSCSATCGEGKRTKRRVCPKGNNDRTTKVKLCKIKNCPPPKPGYGRWAGWGRHGTCSATCGGGTQTRKRKCVNGNSCKGPSTSTRKCNTHTCKGSWTSWAPGGPCSKQCDGGTRPFTRRCRGGSCPGPSSKSVKCNTQTCVGSWGPWVAVTKCTKSCGGGTQTRRRQCSNGNCRGAPKKTSRCNTNRCAVSTSDWSQCTKTCGTGSQYRRKSNGIKQYRSCSNQLCKNANCRSHETRYGIPHECCKSEALAYGQPSCGKQSTVQRIVGGINSKEKRWPWMARIEMDQGGLCAGVIISNRFLVSAAHCFVDASGSRLDTKSWKIHVGILKLDKIGYGGSYTTSIKRVVLHPEFNFPKADIAVVEVKRTLTLTSYILPICLPGGEITPADTKCYVTGWGVSDKPNKATNTLQEVAIQNLKLDVCRESFKINFKEHSDFVNKENRILCAGSIDKRTDSCVGDSGGPLACQRCTSCTWYLAGIVSFGKNDPCAQKGVPGIYTRVLDYETWIHGITKIPKKAQLCLRKIGP